MPAFERNHSLQTGVLALQRAEILANISAQLSRIADAKDRVITNGRTCHVEYQADCINCSSRRVQDCYYDVSVSEVWDQLEYRKADLMRQASLVRRMRKNTMHNVPPTSTTLQTTLLKSIILG